MEKALSKKFIPFGERVPNPVDLINQHYKELVAQIRASCRHEYFPLSDLVREDNRQRGFIIIRQYDKEKEDYSNVTLGHSICLHCSSKQPFSANLCPECFSPTKKLEIGEVMKMTEIGAYLVRADPQSFSHIVGIPDEEGEPTNEQIAQALWAMDILKCPTCSFAIGIYKCYG